MLAKTNESSRILWIDVLKGLGIMAVVYGHVATNLWTQFIYVFHMPLFFCVSGFLHRSDSKYGAYAKKKAIQLLVPYASFVLIISALKLWRNAYQHFPHFSFIKALVIALWGGSRMVGMWGVLWFLPCLYLTQLLMNLLLTKFRLSTVAAIVGAGMLLAYGNYIYAPNFSLPLDANVVLAAMPFFLIGHMMGKAHIPRWIWIGAGIVGPSIALILLFRGVAISYDMRAGNYGVPGLSLVVALCCVAGAVELSKAISAVAMGQVIRRLGEQSLGVMLIHKVLPAFGAYGHIRALGIGADFVFLVAASYFITLWMTKHKPSKALLLGNEKSFKGLFFNRPEIREEQLATVSSE